MTGRITRPRWPGQVRAKFVAAPSAKAEENMRHCAVIRRAGPPLIFSSRVAGPHRGRRESRSVTPRSQPSGHRSFLADRAGGGTPGCGLAIRGDEGSGRSTRRAKSNRPRDQLVLRCGPIGRLTIAWRQAGFDPPPVHRHFDPSMPGFG